MKRLVLLLVALIVGCAAIEAVARVRMRLKYGRYNADFYASHVDEATNLRLPDASQDVGRIHINALGLRGPEIEEPRRPETVRIAFVGGSTTFCAEVDGDSMWPVAVCKRLEAKEPGLHFEPIVAARPAQYVEESRKLIALKVVPLAPDVIVFYEATNDLTRDTRRLAVEQGLFTGNGDDRSPLAKLSVAWDLVEKNIRAAARKRAASSEQERLKFDADELAKGFETALTGLVVQCRAITPAVALVTFSTQLRASQSHDAQLAAAVSSLYYMPYMDLPGLLAGFSKYDDAIRRVAAANGTALIEAADVIPGDAAHFHDSVHFTEAGCAVMADLVVAGLEKDPEFAKAIAKRRAGAPH